MAELSERPVILLGYGGHARVLAEILTLQSRLVLGFATAQRQVEGVVDCKLCHLGDDSALLKYSPDDVFLVNGVGSVRDLSARTSLFEKFKKLRYAFLTLVHPSAVIASDVRLGEGAQIMAGAILQPGVAIGPNSIVNTSASADHDCNIGAHAHLAPGVVLSGGVTVGNRSHLGTASSVIQNIVIGDDVFVAAGSVVVQNLPDRCQARGVPARLI